ncbi:HPr kinase/phosphatase C-terminal domain-containing protein [Roseovarius nubinhibens]|uniref:Serine kinase n=1 Tax=Roseovarius nubinhibens TaxID=314263 RepID=A0A348WBS1_9RHOB|nr:serine kinase [Roseovarius nubinhibens]|tara:strand:- start:506 stop:970 length:465 start_codon:yes stop_codon:yes gene_type:complete
MPGETRVPDARRAAVTPGESIHASCVALGGRALLIRGASGAGKSALALELISRGAALVSDDQTILRREGDQVIASAPPSIKGRIEARGVGLLHAPEAGPSEVAALVDLSQVECERLPPARETDILGVTLPVIHRSDMTCFPAALILYLTDGRYA